MKKIFAILSFGFLAACGATPEEQQFDLMRIQEKLPEGCKVTYAGNVRIAESDRESRIFYTVCGKVTTTTENHEYKSGKSVRTESNAIIHVNDQ